MNYELLLELNQISALFFLAVSLKQFIWNKFKAVKSWLEVPQHQYDHHQSYPTFSDVQVSKLNIFLQEKRCISTHIVVFLLEMSLVSLTWSGKIMHSSITALCPQCNSQNQSYFKTS